MRIGKRAVAASGLALLAAAFAIAQTAEPPPGETAVVVIFLPDGFPFLPSVEVRNASSGDTLGVVSPGGSLRLEMPAGRTGLSIEAGLLRQQASLTVNAWNGEFGAGETLFLEVYANFALFVGGYGLRSVDEAAFMAAGSFREMGELDVAAYRRMQAKMKTPSFFVEAGY